LGRIFLMFTGIIFYEGLFRGYRRGKQELALETPSVFPAVGIGQSIAVNGVCLSLSRKEANIFFFDLSRETLTRTNLGSLAGGEKVNLELPLTLQELVGGHLITGHVDGKGKTLRIVRRPPGRRVAISFPPDLRPYLTPKGSVAVNGVSLTIAALQPSFFEVELIPMTIAKSNLRDLRRGQDVNLECDILGKYVYNWLNRGKKER
jgi:riboflavin synthase